MPLCPLVQQRFLTVNNVQALAIHIVYYSCVLTLVNQPSHLHGSRIGLQVLSYGSIRACAAALVAAQA